MQADICAVFDIDDTLYLERDYVQSGFEAVGQWASRWLRIQDFSDRCLKAFNSGIRGSIFQIVLSECGCSPKSGLIETLVAIYRTHIPKIELLPDAREALLATSAFAQIAVITDGPISSQSRKSDALRLHQVASPIILTELLGPEYRKPHLRAFEEIAHQYPGRTCVYVADNPRKDFCAPIELGWRTIRVRRPEGLYHFSESSPPFPDLEMQDCTGIVEFLHQI